MSFKIIYEPKGRAKEYGDLALNIYNGCSFGCTYCFAPLVLKKNREQYHSIIKVRDNLLEKVEKDCQSGLISRPVHLCFTCDPYQDIDLKFHATREVLKLFKKYNVNFQILTKGGMRAARDFDLQMDSELAREAASVSQLQK
jgi:DNA repair photolyase